MKYYYLKVAHILYAHKYYSEIIIILNFTHDENIIIVAFNVSITLLLCLFVIIYTVRQNFGRDNFWHLSFLQMFRMIP